MADKLITQVKNPSEDVTDEHILVQVSDDEDDINSSNESLPHLDKQQQQAKVVAMNVEDKDAAKSQKKQKSKPSFFARCMASFACCAKANHPQQLADSQPERIEGSLLPPLHPDDKGKKTLVLDLDETLVHSSFKPVPNPDCIVSLELEGEIHHVYVLKRPGLDEFLKDVCERFEVVVFTASLGKYADPLMDMLDPHKRVRSRLFREACVEHHNTFVKDLSLMGRPMSDIMIVDNSPYSYIFQPDNAIPVTSWFNDMSDKQLGQLSKFLTNVEDVPDVCDALLEHRRGWVNLIS